MAWYWIKMGPKCPSDWAMPVDPFKTIKEYGPGRGTLVHCSAIANPWDNLKIQSATESTWSAATLLGPYRNYLIISFALCQSGCVCLFDSTKRYSERADKKLDQWNRILSLQDLIAEVRKPPMEQLTDATKATRAIHGLYRRTQLSNWYDLRLARKRILERGEYECGISRLLTRHFMVFAEPVAVWCLLLRHSIRIGYFPNLTELVDSTRLSQFTWLIGKNCDAA